MVDPLGALLVDFARFWSMPRILSATGTTNYAAPLDKSSGGSSGGSSGEKRRAERAEVRSSKQRRPADGESRTARSRRREAARGYDDNGRGCCRCCGYHCWSSDHCAIQRCRSECSDDDCEYEDDDMADDVDYEDNEEEVILDEEEERELGRPTVALVRNAPASRDALLRMRDILIVAAKHRKLPRASRGKHRAAADALLLWAHTRTFAVAHRYAKVTSDPTPVFARDLGGPLRHATLEAAKQGNVFSRVQSAMIGLNSGGAYAALNGAVSSSNSSNSTNSSSSSLRQRSSSPRLPHRHPSTTVVAAVRRRRREAEPTPKRKEKRRSLT